jgi:hypothetical protein
MTARSIWHNMIDQSLLARNVFSLKLSKSPQEDGEIMFGGVNKSRYTGKLKSVPRTKLPNPTEPEIKKFFNSGWQIPIFSIALGNSHFSLSRYTAVIATSYPGMKLRRTSPTISMIFCLPITSTSSLSRIVRSEANSQI